MSRPKNLFEKRRGLFTRSRRLFVSWKEWSTKVNELNGSVKSLLEEINERDFNSQGEVSDWMRDMRPPVTGRGRLGGIVLDEGKLTFFITLRLPSENLLGVRVDGNNLGTYLLPPHGSDAIVSEKIGSFPPPSTEKSKWVEKTIVKLENVIRRDILPKDK